MFTSLPEAISITTPVLFMMIIISKAPWSIVFDDVEDKLHVHVFNSLFSSILDQHAVKKTAETLIDV